MSIVDQAKEIRRKTESAAQTLPDEQALESITLFPNWKESIGKEVEAGKRVQYEDVLYECIQAHAPLPDWTPDATPALWRRVSIEEWPEWIQPAGGHDAYAKDAKVTHNGKRWINTTDGNVWEPGVHGWNEEN